MAELDPPKGAYRTPDHDRAQEKRLLADFDAEIARQRARDRQRVRRARFVGLFVSGISAALFAVAMAGNLAKEGLTANGLPPLLACAAVVLVLALLVRRARVVLRNRGDLTRQKMEADIAEQVAEHIRAAHAAKVPDEEPLEDARACVDDVSR